MQIAPLLVVCSSVPPQVGGIASLLEIVCATLMRSIDRELHLLCPPGTGGGLAHAVHDRLAWPRRGTLNLPLQTRNAWLFGQLMRRERFELVIFLDAAARLYGLAVAPQTEAIVYVHGHELRAYSAPGEFLSRRLALQCRALRRAHRVLVNSRATGELLRARVPDVEFRVLYPCYDPRRIYDPARHTESPYREPPGTFVLLTVSRVVERKGHDHVLRLLARLNGQLPRYRYYVVGDGPQRAVLKQIAHELGLSERVVFTGSVPTEQLGAYFHHADLFVMLSRPARVGFEGFGLTYVEAGLSGTAAVGNAHGGAVEAVQHDVTGWILDTDQEERAAKELLALVRDADRRRRYAEAARAWAVRELDPARFVRELLGHLSLSP
ncbi:MAG: glycosyltransferase family 4 protein [Candidatus Rokuibacteriota bacterium]